METKSLEERVRLLENDLRGLPERVGAVETQSTAVVAQHAECRHEVRAEFSSLRGDMTLLRGDMVAMRDTLVARIALIGRG